MDERVVTLSQSMLDEIVEAAAERGATRALEKVGLHDKDAGGDIRDLRTLLDSYRTVRNGALSTIGKGIGVAILAVLAWFAGKHYGG